MAAREGVMAAVVVWVEDVDFFKNLELAANSLPLPLEMRRLVLLILAIAVVGGVEERIQSGALLKRFLVMLHLDALDDVAVVSVWTCICSQTTHALRAHGGRLGPNGRRTRTVPRGLCARTLRDSRRSVHIHTPSAW